MTTKTTEIEKKVEKLLDMMNNPIKIMNRAKGIQTNNGATHRTKKLIKDMENVLK